MGQTGYSSCIRGKPHTAGKPQRKMGIFKGFTQDQLDKAFAKVAEPDWRDPIWAVVDRDEVPVTCAAIEFFTATTATVMDLGFRDEFSVKSIGYRMGSAGV